MENTNETNEKSLPLTTSNDEKDLIISMRKLDLIKELGEKQNQFQRLHSQLQQNTDVVTRENQVLREFRKELEMLIQERMSHIEELRLIHADINIMETTIKQAEEERVKVIQESQRLIKDYKPIKEQINKIREMLNLERLNDQDEDEPTAIAIQLFSNQTIDQDLSFNRNNHQLATGSDHTHEHISLGAVYPSQASQISNTNLGTTSNNSQMSTLCVPKTVNGIGLNPDRPTFRQQPPPMKTCQSCQQQIHRNAPICPICKAKSRSRNPKKPKRRLTEVPS